MSRSACAQLARELAGLLRELASAGVIERALQRTTAELRARAERLPLPPPMSVVVDAPPWHAFHGYVPPGALHRSDRKPRRL